jgi:hypothetical protein
VDDSSVYIDNAYFGQLEGIVGSDMQHQGTSGNVYMKTRVFDSKNNDILSSYVDGKWDTTDGWPADGRALMTSSVRFQNDAQWYAQESFLYGSQAYSVKVFDNCTYGDGKAQSMLAYAMGTYHGDLTDW